MIQTCQKCGHDCAEYENFSGLCAACETEDRVSMANCVKKGYLYGDEGGTDYMAYQEFAEEHIQDSEIAYELGGLMLGRNPMESTNFDEHASVFEVYTITNRDEFERQMNEYEGRN